MKVKENYFVLEIDLLNSSEIFSKYLTESRPGLFVPSLILSQSSIVYVKISFTDRLERTSV